MNHQNVHGAVANVAEHIRSFELGQVLCHSRKALRKHFCAYDLNGIILSTEGKTDAPVAAKVSLELFFLRADPCEGQANRQKDFCLREIAEAQFPCHSRKGEDVGFFVHGLVGGESLVSFANAVPCTLIF